MTTTLNNDGLTERLITSSYGEGRAALAQHHFVHSLPVVLQCRVRQLLTTGDEAGRHFLAGEWGSCARVLERDGNRQLAEFLRYYTPGGLHS